MISNFQANELLEYHPTGILTWRVDVRKQKAGDVACRLHKSSGYRVVLVDGFFCQAHRLIWLIKNGAWPEKNVDHIDGDKTNNKIENLRDVSHAVNIQNQRRSQSNSKSGALGVSPVVDSKKKPWKAMIRVDGKTVHLGAFKTIPEAQACYLTAKRALHKGCTI